MATSSKVWTTSNSNKVCLDKDCDEQAGMCVCDSCHKKYPHAKHMFPIWKPEVTEESVKLFGALAAPNYVDLARAAATLFALYNSSDGTGSSSSSSGSFVTGMLVDSTTVVAAVLNDIFGVACSSVAERAESRSSILCSSRSIQHTHRLHLG